MNAPLPSSVSLQTASSEDVWSKYSQGIAWWTVALFAVVMLSYSGLIYGVYSQSISLPMGAVLATIILYLGFTVAHEAGHGNIAHEVAWMKPVERAMGWCATQLFLLIPFGLFAKIHDYHHAFTNDPDRDPDHWVIGDKWWQASLRAPTLAVNYLYLTLTRFKNDPVITKTHKSSLIYYSVSLAIISTLLISGYWLELLVVGILPIFMSSYILGMLFDWIPHKPTRQQDRYQNTRSYLFPGLRFLTLGQNYHHIHHLYPRVSWYNYHRVFDLIRPELEAKNSPIEELFSNSQPGYGESPFALEPSNIDGVHRMTLRVSELRHETEDSVAITFEQPWKNTLDFKPGQYVTVSKLIDGEYVTRCYSICESPYSGKLTIGAKKVTNGMLSSYLNDQLKVGDELTVAGPFGDFTYAPPETAEKQSLVLVAGGSGITPVLSIARSALDYASDVTVHLVYANRDISNVMFSQAINLLMVNHPNRFRVSFIFEQGHSGWEGETGYLTDEMINRLLATDKKANKALIADSQFYICGPKPMKDAVVHALINLRLSPEHIHVEEFSQAGPKAEGTVYPVEVALANGVTHQLKVAENQTVLQAAMMECIKIPHACGVGQCGCCMMKIGKGEVELVSDETPGLLPGEKQQGFTLACQCKPKSALTLIEGKS